MRFLSEKRVGNCHLALFGAISVLTLFGAWGCSTASQSLNAGIPGSRFAYVTNQGDNTVSAYSVDETTGALTSIGKTPVGSSPLKSATAAIGVNKNFLYVLNQLDKTISQFSVGSNGSLTPLSPATVIVGNQPSDIIFGAGVDNSTSNNATYRIYVTNLGDNSVMIFHIKDDGSLSLLSTKQGISTPTAINSIGPDFDSPDRLSKDQLGVFTKNIPGSKAHSEDFGYLVANRDAATVTLFENVPDDLGGLKSHTPLTLPTGASPNAISGGNTFCIISNGKADKTTFEVFDINRSDPLKEIFNQTVSTPGGPVSVAIGPGALYDYAYIGTGDGHIYQFNEGDTHSSPLGVPIQVNPQNLFLRFHQNRLYVVKPADRAVVSYQRFFDDSNSKDGVLDTASLLSVDTGANPTSIAFINTSLTAGAIKTAIK